MSDSWVTDLLVFAPPVGWTIVGGIYSGEFVVVVLLINFV
jgi:hypothetical protein